MAVARASSSLSPSSRARFLPSPGRLRHQNLVAWSLEPEASRWPSGCHASDQTADSCAWHGACMRWECMGKPGDAWGCMGMCMGMCMRLAWGVLTVRVCAS